MKQSAGIISKVPPPGDFGMIGRFYGVIERLLAEAASPDSISSKANASSRHIMRTTPSAERRVIQRHIAQCSRNAIPTDIVQSPENILM